MQVAPPAPSETSPSIHSRVKLRFAPNFESYKFAHCGAHLIGKKVPARSLAALRAACFLFLGARAPGLRVSRQAPTDRDIKSQPPWRAPA